MHLHLHVSCKKTKKKKTNQIVNSVYVRVEEHELARGVQPAPVDVRALHAVLHAAAHQPEPDPSLRLGLHQNVDIPVLLIN
jgi:hypothetical protein